MKDLKAGAQQSSHATNWLVGFEKPDGHTHTNAKK